MAKAAREPEGLRIQALLSEPVDPVSRAVASVLQREAGAGWSHQAASQCLEGVDKSQSRVGHQRP